MRLGISSVLKYRVIVLFCAWVFRLPQSRMAANIAKRIRFIIDFFCCIILNSTLQKY